MIRGRKLTAFVVALAMVFASAVMLDPASAASKPAKVKGVKVVSRTASSVTLKWKKAKRAKKYQIKYKKIGAKKYKKAITKKRRIKIRNLKSNAKYVFRVRGKNTKYGKFSKKIVVRTKKRSGSNNHGLKTKKYKYTSFNAEQALKFLNKERIKNNRHPLGINKEACKAATLKAKAIFEERKGHDSGGGSKIYQNAGLTTLGEVIVRVSSKEEWIDLGADYNYDPSKECVEKWMTSPNHKKTLMLINASTIGFGTFKDVAVGVPIYNFWENGTEVYHDPFINYMQENGEYIYIPSNEWNKLVNYP